MYKYLLWDIDGTVLDFQAAEKEAIKALFKKYNLGICTDEMISDYSKINHRYWEALERGEMTKPQILVGRFVEFFSSISVDTSVAAEFNDDYQVALGDYVIFEDNAMNVLKSEKGHYKLIAVTNGTKIAQTKKLKTSGLDEIFDSVYISEDIGYEKPSIQFFEYLFEHENISDKSLCLIIGDSLTSDILGGNNAGIDTCWYNKNKKPLKGEVSVTYEINNLTELDNIL